MDHEVHTQDLLYNHHIKKNKFCWLTTKQEAGALTSYTDSIQMYIVPLFGGTC